MMDNLDMRVLNKVGIFLRDNIQIGKWGRINLALWSDQTSMGGVINSLKIPFRQL